MKDLMTKIYKAKCPTALLLTTLVLFFVGLFALHLTHEFTYDAYFMITTGRKMWEEGAILTVNPWSRGDIIVQQWFYCLIFSGLYDTLGAAGYWMMIILPVILLICAVYLYLSQYKISPFRAICFGFILLTLGSQYIFVPRPEALTLALLVLEMYCLERYRDTKKWGYLVWLPVFVIVEMNVHMSMWPFHIAVLLAYSVPLPKTLGIKSDSIGLKGSLIGFVTSLAAIFVNPYGLDGVLYMPRFYIDKSQILAIREMQPPLIASVITVVIVLCAAIWFYFKPKSFGSSALWLAAGFTVLSLMAYRNLMFMMLMFLPLIPVINRAVTDRLKFDIKQQSTWFNSVCLIVAAFCVFMGANFAVDPLAQRIEFMKDFGKVIEDKKTCNLFVGFNFGSVFEYLGYENVYMDARPEIYAKSYGSYTLYDYASVITGYKHEYSSFEPGPWTAEDYEYWLQSNAFEYMIVEPDVEGNLMTYLMLSPDWELLSSTEDGGLVIYGKVEECSE